MRQHVYFTEDQRWPSKSQRFGWLVVMSIAIFIAFQVNLHLFAPLYAVPVLLFLLLVVLTVLTLHQRLTVRIGSERLEESDAPAGRRLWRRAAQVAPLVPLAGDDEAAQVIRIVYVFKGPVSALAPGRRGSRLGRSQQRVPLSDVRSWSASRIPLFASLRRGGDVFPVGLQRDAVTLILEDGRRLMIPTRLQPALLEALSTAKVDSVRQEREAQITREEL